MCASTAHRVWLERTHTMPGAGLRPVSTRDSARHDTVSKAGASRGVGHIRRVADDSHARDHRRRAPSEVGAVGPRVEDVVWLLCPAVRAGVRGTVRGSPVHPGGAARVCCSIRGACPHSWEPGSHGNALGSHHKLIFGKLTILMPLSTLRVDVDRFRPTVGSVPCRDVRA